MVLPAVALETSWSYERLNKHLLGFIQKNDPERITPLRAPQGYVEARGPRGPRDLLPQAGLFPARMRPTSSRRSDYSLAKELANRLSIGCRSPSGEAER